MGKASKRLARQQHKNKLGQQKKTKQELKAKFMAQVEQGVYDEALGTLADLVKAESLTPDLYYGIAYCYFMTGDYERAAQWLDNTLQAVPGHIKGRILLARLCLLQERTDDGLAIFDFVLENWQESLTEDMIMELTEILSFYGKNDREKLQSRYPAVASFLKLDEEAAAVSQPEEDDPLAKAKAAIAAMNKIMEKNNAEAEAVLQQRQAQQAAVPVQSDEAANKIAEVATKDISREDKLCIYNSYAGGYYLAGDYQTAKRLLEAAVGLELNDEQTFKNMVYTELALGNVAEAEKYLPRIKHADFALLKAVKEAK